jgi:5-methylcytosine-specific restriction endonuclease McrA
MTSINDLRKLRDKDSNLEFHVQSVASCRLLHPAKCPERRTQYRYPGRVFVRTRREHVFVSRTDEVRELHETGLTGRAIAEQLGIAPATVCHHLRRLGVPAQRQPRYDWAEVQRFYDEDNSITKCQRRVGMARKTFLDAAHRGAIVTRPQAMPVDQLLSGRRNRNHVKQRLIAAGLREPRCARCGIDEWRGQPIALQLHHVNGHGQHNRLENLELLCPNCHAQTDTWGGRNRRVAACR